MGTIYARGSMLWIAWFDETGRRQQTSTRLPVGPENELRAQKMLDVAERKVRAAKAVPGARSGPLLVRDYAEHWIADRLARDVGSAATEKPRLRDYILPQLGKLELAKVRPSHIRDFVRHLRTKMGPARGQLAPRTVHHIYGQLHTMLAEAVVDEHLEANPCVLKRGEMPKKADKDPTWRAGAVYSRDEVELLISHADIAEERRVLYAVLFLAGLRINEAAARRWRDYDATLEPLGRLMVATNYNRKKKREKGVKTDVPRMVPVHATLARVLAAWKLSGWARLMGAEPGPDDLLIPSGAAARLNDTTVLRHLHGDLEALGLRRRRTHDTRRTFISLALADGARKDLLAWVTHGPPGDVMGAYTTLPWASLCGEVSKLNIGLREGRVLSLARASGSEEPFGQLLQPLLHSTSHHEKTQMNQPVAAILRNVDAGSSPVLAGVARGAEATASAPGTGRSTGPWKLRNGPAESDCSNVAEADFSAPERSDADIIAAEGGRLLGACRALLRGDVAEATRLAEAALAGGAR